MDTTPPELSSGPGALTVNATGVNTTVTWTAPTATDFSPVAPAVTCSPASGSEFVLGTTSVTCSATDDAGLTSSVTFTVTVGECVGGVRSC